VRITVHAELGERLTLVVADDGPGVSQEDAGKIFQPFFSTKARGHGLGLALSSRVLSFMDGKLVLLNPGERGARFEVSTPAYPGSPCGT
jgi:signal transduction histidine kinase